MIRPYTGYVAPPHNRVQAGTKAFIDRVCFLSGGALWNNGDWGIRDMRSKVGVMSRHAQGDTVDLSYRRIGDKGKNHGRRHAVNWCRILSQNADALQIEMIIDYFPSPFGRAWKCQRETARESGTWKKYTKATVHGAPRGDWLHIELSPFAASHPQFVIDAFSKLFIPAVGLV